MKYSNRLKPWIAEQLTLPEIINEPRIHRMKRSINYKYLSQNENAMELLMNNQDKIDWDGLSANLSATELLYANQEKISIHRLVDNPHPLAIKLLSENVECIRDWNALLRNPAAVSIWRQNADIAMLDGYHIPEHYLTSELPSPWYNMGYSDPRDKFIDLFISKMDPDGFDFDALCDKDESTRINSRYYYWTSRTIDRITRKRACEILLNRNPKILKILEEVIYPEQLHWGLLSTNPAAIEFLEKHKESRYDNCVCWNTIWANPAIFEEEYDYEGMRQTPRVVEAELLAAVMHPDRADAYLAAGGTLQEFGALYGRK